MTRKYPLRRARRVTTRNATFQTWHALLHNRKKRNRAGAMLVQGVRPIRLALGSGLAPRAVLVADRSPGSRWAEETVATAQTAGAETYVVAPDLLHELGEKDDEAPEVLLVVEIPPDDVTRIPASTDLLAVALDRPASPGNLGSTIRSVDALGGHGVLVTGHAADPYDPKALRAATGSTFLTPTVRLPGPADVLAWVRDLAVDDPAVQVVGTDESGDRDLWDVDLTRPTILVAGNEHSGMSSSWREACDLTVRIPIGGHASSLNAANATTVALYEARRQRHHAAGPTP